MSKTYYVAHPTQYVPNNPKRPEDGVHAVGGQCGVIRVDREGLIFQASAIFSEFVGDKFGKSKQALANVGFKFREIKPSRHSEVLS